MPCDKRYTQITKESIIDQAYAFENLPNFLPAPVQGQG
jgi:hypothetical protein